MPNHYTNIVIAYGAAFAAQSATAGWAHSLLSRVCPQPKEIPRGRLIPGTNTRSMSSAEAEWCRANWGTKWDTYDEAPPRDLPGDGGPLLFSFATAWSEPLPAVRQLAINELFALTYEPPDEPDLCVNRVVWLGLDPSDDSFRVLDDIKRGDA